LTEQIRQLRAEEVDLGRLLLHSRIGQEAYDQLRHEWQQKLGHKQQELETLQREASVYIDDLDAAVMLLSRLPLLFERLAKRDRPGCSGCYSRRLWSTATAPSSMSG
jgi:hypothetical protein